MRQNIIESEPSKFLPTPDKRVFYGWWIVIGCMGTMAMSTGIGFFGHGLILDPLQDQYGWSKGVVTSGYTLFLLMAAITGSLIGEKIDKYGPKPIFCIGAIFMGLSLILLSRVTHLWQFYSVYLLMSVGWISTHAVPVSTVVSNWFIRKRGRAMSIAMTGMSFGGIIVVPIASRLIHYYGLKIALPILGLTYCIVIIPIAVFVFKKSPAEINLLPDGDFLHLSNSKGRDEHPDYNSQTQNWTRRQVMGTRNFWSIVVAFFLACICLVTFLIHEVSFLSQKLGPIGAATAVSVTSLASMTGRLIMGAAVDRFDKRFATIVCFVLQGTSVFAITYVKDITLLYVCVVVFGLSVGNIVMMQALLISECFGFVSYGKVAGLAGLFISSGSALGPMLAGILFDLTNSYRISFNILGIACGFASISILFAGRPTPTRDISYDNENQY